MESPRLGQKNPSNSNYITIGINGLSTKAQIALRAVRAMHATALLYVNDGFPMVYQGITAAGQTYRISRTGLSDLTGVQALVISATGHIHHFGKSGTSMIDPRYARINSERAFRAQTYDLALNNITNGRSSNTPIYSINFRDRDRALNDSLTQIVGSTDSIEVNVDQLIETQDTIQAPFSVYSRTIRGT